MKATGTRQTSEQVRSAANAAELPAAGNRVATARAFNWLHNGQRFEVEHHRFGSGKDVLFLPAMSTVSTLREWEAVATGLGKQFRVTLIDWPGFGASSRLRTDYSPVLYDAFLREFLGREFREPVAVVAAGHAAGYVLRLASVGNSFWSCAALVAPTWRGPMPTAMGEHPMLYAVLRNFVAVPGLGHALYHVNTFKWFLRQMYGRHVYANYSRLTPDFLAEKQRVARQRGARFAASAFVTGALDPFPCREVCCEALRSARFPVLCVLGENTPSKSRAEMAALADACLRPPLIVPGSLGVHEESAEALIAPMCELLSS